MRISDWSSDVCSSDLAHGGGNPGVQPSGGESDEGSGHGQSFLTSHDQHPRHMDTTRRTAGDRLAGCAGRSEEHTSELQSLMRISYAVFCLNKKNDNHTR